MLYEIKHVERCSSWRRIHVVKLSSLQTTAAVSACHGRHGSNGRRSCRRFWTLATSLTHRSIFYLNGVHGTENIYAFWVFSQHQGILDSCHWTIQVLLQFLCITTTFAYPLSLSLGISGRFSSISFFFVFIHIDSNWLFANISQYSLH